MKATRLQVENLEAPIGIDVASPRFSWNCEGGVLQSAYQIRVTRDGEEIWNTGKVSSSEMTWIEYQGKSLASRDKLTWSVVLWDETDEEGGSVESFFEIGLLKKEDWKAKWIAGDYRPSRKMRYPVDCFRKTFSLTDPVKCARLYITACGIYEAHVNGKRVGDFVLAPGNTDCRKRIQYQTYDVTDLLQSGNRKNGGNQGKDGSRLSVENELTVDLADGWYRGSIGCFGPTNVFGNRTKFLCQLEITYVNGESELVMSDSSFSWSNDGPVRFADLKDGEKVDASKSPSYKDRAIEVGEKIVPSASDNVAVTRHEKFVPRLITSPSGQKIMDFGQNLAGFVSFSVKGNEGDEIRLKMGEILDEKGEFSQKNMQIQKPAKGYTKISEIMTVTGNIDKVRGEKALTPLQEIEFICSGGEDHYETRFAIFGFRYALIVTELEVGPGKAVDPDNFCSIAVYSDLEQTAEFVTSNDKINRLFQNACWSMKGNFADVPTDCPTRERLGWTGDAQVFFESGAYLMNTAPFFRKYLKDMRDNISPKGKLSAVVPYNGCSLVYDNTGASVGWGDAAVLIPCRFYKVYGDVRVLEENYGMMKSRCEFMIRNTGHKDKNKARENPCNRYTYEKGLHLGEWLEAEEFKEKITAGSKLLHTEECTAYLHYTMRHMAEAAKILKREEDEKRYREYAEGAKKAYQWLFLRNGIPDTDRQAKLVRPLAFGLAEGGQKEALEKRLAQAVENRNYKVMTGFLSTPFLLQTLTDAGRSDLAYRMLLNEERPGWLHEVNQGATTIWEDWEGKGSHDHYSPGAVVQWMMENILGIRVDRPRHFVIAPRRGGNLLFARGAYQSIYGTVRVEWEGDRLEVTVPPNTEASILTPGTVG